MAIATTIFAAAGIGQQLLSGVSAQDKANAANIAAASKANLENFQAIKQNELLHKQAEAQWAWDKAQVAQLRMVEAQNAVDQAAYGTKLIENATRNMEINLGALRDRFETEEQLRATQVGMEYSYQQAKRVDETTQATIQYMNNINQRALQARLVEQQLGSEVQQLQQGIAIDAAKDSLGYQMKQMEAIAAGAQLSGRAIVNQGGGKTSQRLAIQAGQDLGQLYAQLDLKSRERAMKVSLLNSTVQNEFATRMTQFALESESDANSIKYMNSRLAADTALAQKTLGDLTLPSFQLAENQYGRELASLQLKTDQVYDQASQTYRMKEYLDPMAPIQNPNPVFIGPSKVMAPSGGAIIGSALIAGVKGAISAYDSESNTFH